MALATTVEDPADPGDAPRVPDGLYGWDWSATTHDATHGTVADLLTRMHAHTVLPGKGAQGWALSANAFDARGDKLGSVYFGGGRDDLHVLATSGPADVVRRRIAVAGHHDRFCPEGCEDFHGPKTARVDTRVDTLVPFNELEDLIRFDVAPAYNTRVTRYESWEGKGDSLGRTIYLGSPKSAIRVRVYEKWRESPGEWVEGANRVEVQLRPPSRAKAGVTAWTPAQTFCASRVTRELAKKLGNDVAEPGSLHVAKPTPTLEQALAAMGKQYGNRFAEWMAVSGGDAGKVLDYLMEKGPLPLDAD